MLVRMRVFLTSTGAYFLISKWLTGKESACQYRRCRRRCVFDPWRGKIPWNRKWQPTPAFFFNL